MANPTFVLGSTSSNSNSFTKPGSTVNGDWLQIIYHWFNSTTGTPSAPSGWSTVFNDSAPEGVANLGTACFIRKVDGTEGAGPYVVTRPSGSVFWDGGGIHKISGADGTTPTDDTGTNQGLSSPATSGAAIDTPAGSEDILFWAGTSGGSTFATPSGMASAWNLDGGDSRAYTETLSSTLTGATRSSALTGGNGDWSVGWHAVKPPAAGGAFTLTADPGSFAITGTAASLEFGRRLDAAAGSFAVTGTAASLEKGFEVAADPGAYTITGTAATLQRTARLSADSGAFSITGTAASLEKGFELAADPGAFAISGTAATFRVGHRLAADAGSFAISGTAASLEAGRLLSAASGSFAITGTDAALVHGQAGNFTLVAEPGAFTITGTAAGVLAARRLIADAGSVSITGTAASLGKGRTLTAVAGSFDITGTAATFDVARLLSALSGSFDITGTAAALSWSGESATISRAAVRGSYQPTVPMTGSYAPTVAGLTGSNESSVAGLRGSVE